MTTPRDFARTELEKELRDKLETFIRLAEVSKRAIRLEKQDLANYVTQIGVLQESLRNLKSPRAAQETQNPQNPQEARTHILRRLLETLMGSQGKSYLYPGRDKKDLSSDEEQLEALYDKVDRPGHRITPAQFFQTPEYAQWKAQRLND